MRRCSLFVSRCWLCSRPRSSPREPLAPLVAARRRGRAPSRTTTRCTRSGARPSTARPRRWRSRVRSSAWPRPPAARATGSSPPTAACSRSTRRSTARSASWPLTQPVVGMTATPSGHGLLARRPPTARVFPFGDAKLVRLAHRRCTSTRRSSRSSPARRQGLLALCRRRRRVLLRLRAVPRLDRRMRLNAPVVGMASTPDRQRLLAGRERRRRSSPSATRTSRLDRRDARSTAPVVGMARDGRATATGSPAPTAACSPSATPTSRAARPVSFPPTATVVQLVGMPDGNGYRMLSLAEPARRRSHEHGRHAAPRSSAVQNRLSRSGYWLPGANGVFDADMQQAVWAFQKANGLPRTGAIDAATQAKFRTADPAPRSSTSGYLIEIDKTRQILMVVRQRLRPQYAFNTSTGSDHPYNLDGVGYTAHTPEGMFQVIRQVDGPDTARSACCSGRSTSRGRASRCTATPRCRRIPRRTAVSGSRTTRSTSSGPPTSCPSATTVWVYV